MSFAKDVSDAGSLDEAKRQAPPKPRSRAATNATKNYCERRFLAAVVKVHDFPVPESPRGASNGCAPRGAWFAPWLRKALILGP